MDEKQFDSLIRRTLSDKTEDLTPSSDLQEQIMETIRIRSKERWIMKKGSLKKMIVIAAAFCILGTAAAIAAGKTTGLYSGHSSQPDYTQYSQIEDAAGKLGYEVRSVEQFDNGYKFNGASLIEVEGRDDDQNKTLSYLEFTVGYRDKTGQNLELIVRRRPDEIKSMDTAPADASKVVSGFNVKYKVDKYLFLPPDAQPSEEEKQAEARGELYISYGSQEAETRYFYYGYWEQGGTEYLLMSMNQAFSAEEMYAMAGQVIEAK